jgi:hypothetical protein
MKIKWLLQFLTVLGLLSIFISCEYEFIEVAKPKPPDPNDTTPVDTISFALTIEPIFQSSGCTGCHSSGDINLSAGNAYNSIMTNSLAVPFDPEASKIYTIPHPVSGTHIKKYSSVDDANLIAEWIYQGALNN